MKPTGKSMVTLLFTFMKIGAFTFGGGYAMIPLIQKETVERQKWISPDEILEIVAIAESTPGPIAINAATFVGYKVAGLAGAVCATLGVVLPSFFIIFGLSFIIRQFQALEAVRFAFTGIRAGVLALIVRALISMYKQCPKNLTAYLIFGLAFIAVALLRVNVLLVIVGCAIFGLITSLVADKKQKSKG